MNSLSIIVPMTPVEILQERLCAIDDLLVAATNAAPERIAELRREARQISGAIDLLNAAERLGTWMES